MKEETLRVIDEHFSTSLWLLFPMVAVIAMAAFKMKPFPVILLGALIGGIFAIIFQPHQIVQFVNMPDLSEPLVMVAGVWKAMYTGFTTTTGVESIDMLVNRGRKR